ncbi:MAG TPA: hypothetical protein VJC03_07020, partial [bacterium]|nr:hypothetical protein [bacterium]
EAQRNIARILKDLSEKYEFAKVAMEGSFGKIDTSLLSTIPDKNVRESVAGFFMEKGLLSGTEYAGATSDDSLELQGIENESLYRKDREILESAYTREDEVKNFFKPFKQDVDKELQKILNQELKQFRASLKKEKAASSHIDDLISEANSLQVDLNEYPVLSAFAQMMALKAEIDFARVSRETDYFINLLRKVLSAGQIGILISLRRNEARADQFYSALRQFFLEHKNLLKQGECRNLEKFFVYLELVRMLNPELLVQEEKQLVKNIEQKLIRDDQERTALACLDYFTLLEKVIYGEATPEELDKYWILKNEIGEKTPQFLASLLPGAKVRDRLDRLLPFQSNMEEFYRISLARNTALVENTLKLLKKEDKIALVAGGFHVPGITELLRAKDISFTVTAPQMTTPIDKKSYKETLASRLPPLEAFLVYTLAPATLLNNLAFHQRLFISALSRVIDIIEKDELSAEKKQKYMIHDFFEPWQSAYRARTGKTLDLVFEGINQDGTEYRFTISGEKYSLTVRDGKQKLVRDVSAPAALAEKIPSAPQAPPVDLKQIKKHPGIREKAVELARKIAEKSAEFIRTGKLTAGGAQLVRVESPVRKEASVKEAVNGIEKALAGFLEERADYREYMKTHPQESEQLTERIEKFKTLLRGILERGDIKNNPEKFRKAVELYQKVFGLLLNLDRVDLTLPYTPHGMGHVFRMLDYAQEIISVTGIESSLNEKYHGMGKELAMFVILLHDLGYTKLEDVKIKSGHSGKSIEIIEEDLQGLIRDIFGLDLVQYGELIDAIGFHSEKRKMPAGIIVKPGEKTESDKPLLFVLKLADKMDLTAGRLRPNFQGRMLTFEMLFRLFDPELRRLQQMTADLSGMNRVDAAAKYVRRLKDIRTEVVDFIETVKAKTREEGADSEGVARWLAERYKLPPEDALSLAKDLAEMTDQDFSDTFDYFTCQGRYSWMDPETHALYLSENDLPHRFGLFPIKSAGLEIRNGILTTVVKLERNSYLSGRVPKEIVEFQADRFSDALGPLTYNGHL